MNNEESVNIELQLKEAREAIARADALRRLQDNRDFQAVINRGYLEEEAIRLVHLKAHPGVQADAPQAAITRDIDAIGSLKQHFVQLFQQAEIASRSVADAEEALEELNAEDLG